MTTEQRLDLLENAHRALHARHEALMIVCRVMLPLIKASPIDKQKLILLAYSALSEHMQKNVHDVEFQRFVRVSIDEMASTILIDA